MRTLFWCVVVPPSLIITRLLKLEFGKKIPFIFHGSMSRIFNLQCNYSGEIAAGGSTLFVSNHASYLDVFVLGAVLPANFVAKAEVAKWSVFGTIAAVGQTIFVERNPRRAREQILQLRTLLNNDTNLILFPEGTSTPGVDVERFRSTLFAAADGPDSQIQPVTVAYTHYDGEPMDQTQRDNYAWYLPMTFAPHFLNGLGLKRATVQVTFHPPVSLSQFDNRKACAAHCEAIVGNCLRNTIAEAASEGSSNREPSIEESPIKKSGADASS